LIRGLVQAGVDVIAVSSSIQPERDGVTARTVPNWTASDALARAIDGADAVVHAAGAAHGRVAPTRDAMEAGNVRPARAIADACGLARTPRLVLLSSASVYGAGRDQPYTESDAPADGAHHGVHRSAYGWSKLEAERVANESCAANGGIGVILRAPMIYGIGMPGNPARLLRAIMRGVPLPFASANALRSVLSAENLAVIVGRAVQSAWTAGTYNVGDPDVISMRHFSELLANAVGHRTRFWPFPWGVIRQLIAEDAAGPAQALRRVSDAVGPFALSLERMRALMPDGALLTTAEALDRIGPELQHAR
jgi:UDP-glucose 4-epimerase